MSTKTKAKKKVKRKVNKKLTKKQKKIRRIILWIILIFIILLFVILFLSSPLFDIKSITVMNNNKVTSEEIIQASQVQTNENRFKKSKYKISNNIKTLPYIEDVKITKKLNGELIIDVTERQATYMLIFDGKYAYINNQGYILEVTDIPLELPIITGYSSQNITAGNRLETKDLKKLDTVIKIMEKSRIQGIGNYITSIDITTDRNYILSMPSQMKTIEFGEGTNIDIKILKIIEALKNTEGQAGTIYMKNKMYFHEDV